VQSFRIALCYTAGGLLFIFLRTRGLAAVAAALLLGYWAMLARVPFPDVRPTPGGSAVITKEAGYKNISQLNMGSTNRLRGSYLQGVNLTDYIDQKYLPGRKYDGTYDPEGILSTLPALASGLLGIFAGLLIRNQSWPDGKKVAGLLGGGAAAVALGWIWGMEFPVTKKSGRPRTSWWQEATARFCSAYFTGSSTLKNGSGGASPLYGSA